ncbi:MAG: glycosyltransferase family 1 protein [Calothrix sp. MO_167.B12]|nr:glycosyltransferase family 1 protein [Calothrix sp. MO_167.B12]
MTLLVNLSFAPSQPTGWLNYSLNLLPELQGIDTNIISPVATTGMKCYPSPSNITTDFGMKGHFRRLLWLQWQLPKLYLQMQSQLLFSPVPEAPLFSNCRYIITIHDLIPLRFKQYFSQAQYFYCRYYIPTVIHHSEHVICNSQATAEDLNQFLGVPEDKITAIPLAYHRENFRCLNLPKQNYFLFLGRHNPHKNPTRVITAFSALPNCQDYELWFVGPTDERYTPILRAYVEELGITQQVKFLDYLPYQDLPTIMNQALALVFPSLWEGFGFPVLEAMACGTPVITSNVSSLPEVAGDAAILINPYNTREITEAMHTIATDLQMSDRLSVAGINRANQFSWENTGKATTELLLSYL